MWLCPPAVCPLFRYLAALDQGSCDLLGGRVRGVAARAGSFATCATFFRDIPTSQLSSVSQHKLPFHPTNLLRSVPTVDTEMLSKMNRSSKMALATCILAILAVQCASAAGRETVLLTANPGAAVAAGAAEQVTESWQNQVTVNICTHYLFG